MKSPKLTCKFGFPLFICRFTQLPLRRLNRAIWLARLNWLNFSLKKYQKVCIINCIYYYLVPSGKNRRKTVCRSVFLTIWHCILSVEYCSFGDFSHWVCYMVLILGSIIVVNLSLIRTWTTAKKKWYRKRYDLSRTITVECCRYVFYTCLMRSRYVKKYFRPIVCQK